MHWFQILNISLYVEKKIHYKWSRLGQIYKNWKVNVTRSGVLHQYYGLDIQQIDHNIVRNVAYCSRI